MNQDSQNQSQKENDYYIIYSFEHSAWWKKARHGYSRYLNQAGVYTFEEAKEICQNANMLDHPAKVKDFNKASISEAMIPIPEQLVSYLRNQPSSLV
jgi:hypothetical protein